MNSLPDVHFSQPEIEDYANQIGYYEAAALGALVVAFTDTPLNDFDIAKKTNSIQGDPPVLTFNSNRGNNAMHSLRNLQVTRTVLVGRGTDFRLQVQACQPRDAEAASKVATAGGAFLMWSTRNDPPLYQIFGGRPWAKPQRTGAPASSLKIYNHLLQMPDAADTSTNLYAKVLEPHGYSPFRFSSHIERLRKAGMLDPRDGTTVRLSDRYQGAIADLCAHVGSLNVPAKAKKYRAFAESIVNPPSGSPPLARSIAEKIRNDYGIAAPSSRAKQK